MAEPFRFASDEERQAYRQMINEQLTEKAANDIRGILQNAGFHPDHVPQPLIDLLVDAWMKGGKWGSTLVMHTLIEDGRFDAPERTIERPAP